MLYFKTNYWKRTFISQPKGMASFCSLYVNPDMTFKEQFARNMNNSIFLAGPCPRVDYSQDWRFETFEVLR